MDSFCQQLFSCFSLTTRRTMKPTFHFTLICCAVALLASNQQTFAGNDVLHQNSASLQSSRLQNEPQRAPTPSVIAFQPNQKSVTGTIGNDRITLYGNSGLASTATPVRDPAISRSQTFSSTVAIDLNGTILPGTAAETPTVHFYINGKDYGLATLSSVQSDYSKKIGGIAHSGKQRFIFPVDDIDIRTIKIEIESPAVLRSEVYIYGVTITPEGAADQKVEPSSLRGATVTFATPSRYYDGGKSYKIPYGSIPSDVRSITIDTSLYRKTLQQAPGTPANPLTVHGGGGIDTLYLLGNQDQYVLAGGKNSSLIIAESAGLSQNALATNIAKVEFADSSFFLPPQATGINEAVLAENEASIATLRATLPPHVGMAVHPIKHDPLRGKIGDVLSKNCPTEFYQNAVRLTAPQGDAPMALRSLGFVIAPARRDAPTIKLQGAAKEQEMVVVDTATLPETSLIEAQRVNVVLLSGKTPITFRGNGDGMVILADEGNQEMWGGTGDDLLWGGVGNDNLYGGIDDDLLCGGSGDDVLDGGSGIDAAYFSGKSEEYRITHHPTTSMTTVVDLVAERDGTDNLFNIEQLRFADRTMFLGDKK
uniref:Uncharacterized protein n=1 Tax=Chlorobium chlorochromatii (strain CaD3) TaxID=340177 RepID=Q3APX5_CHLCH